MKKILRLAYYFTLLLLLCALTSCTKAARESRAIARADSDFKAGNYERAEIRYRAALRLRGSESKSLAEVLLKLGRIYYAQGRWLDAVKYLNAGLGGRTNDVPSREMVGESFFFLGFPPQAFEAAAGVLQMQPGHPGAMVMLVDSAGVDKANLTKVATLLQKQPAAAKKTAAYRTAQGTLLLRSGDSNAAEKEYKAALEMDPKFSRAHLGMAHVQIGRKELSKAKDETLAAIAALPNRSGAISSGLEILNLLGGKEEAKRIASDLTQKNPDFVPPYLFLANIALKEQRYDESLALLQKVLAKDSESFVALTMCGDASLARGDGTNALRYYQQAASGGRTVSPSLLLKMGYAYFAQNEVGNAKARFREALEANTNYIYPEAALALSEIAFRQRDERAARELTPKLIKLTNQPLTNQPPWLLGGYIRLVDLYLVQKDFDNAIKVSLTALGRFTNVAELPYRLGSLYDSVGKKAEARKAFEQALGLATNDLKFLGALITHDLGNSRFDDAYSLISSKVKDRTNAAPLHYIEGKVLWAGVRMSDDESVKRERYDLARESFKRAIELDPAYQEPYFSLAQLYEETGRLQEALGQLQDYLGRTNSPSARLLAGQIYEQSKDYINAAGEYEKIVAKNQRNRVTLAALNNLAFLYTDHTTNKWEEAYSLAQRAREMDPRNPSVADTLGWAAFRRGDYSRALTLFQEATADRELAEKPEFLYHLAMANYMAGDEDIARGAFQKALDEVDRKTKGDTRGSSTRQNQEPIPPWVADAKSKMTNLSLDMSAVGPGIEEELENRLSTSPGDPVLVRRLGMVQERRGDSKAALKSYEAALKSNPKHTGIQLQLALLYAGPMTNLARGLELAKQAKIAAPNDPEAVRVVGQLAYRSGDYRLAVALLQESVANYPNDASLNYDLGAALYGIGRVDDAEEAIRRAAESGAAVSQGADAKQFLSFITATKEPGRHPDTVQFAISTLAKVTNDLPALMLVAVDAEFHTNSTKAVEIYSRILRDYPMFFPAYRNLGLLHFNSTQDRDKAYELLSKVREQYSEDVVFCRALGIMACQHGEYTRAAQLLQSDAGARADDSEALFYLGKAQLNTKRPDDAWRTLERAVEKGLRKDLEQEARKLLASRK